MIRKLIKNKDCFFWIVVLALAVAKQLLVVGIPLLAYSNQACDDMLMINLARNILAGEWLGEYNELTLVKGSFFPLLLACINKVGLSYMGVMNGLYTISCMIFCKGVEPLFKRKRSLALLYGILLFNPVSFAAWTFQRVYRNGITLVQVLIIFGSFFAIYLRRKRGWKELMPWAFLAGVTLISLWHTREDGIWIMPFVFVATVVLIVLTCAQFKKNKKKRDLLIKVLIFISPLILLCLGNNVVRAVNYMEYGVFSYNEINDSSFTDAMKSIYSVENSDVIPYVSVTREKMNRLYEASPSLNNIRTEMDSSMDAWDYNDRNPGDGEVEDGWFFWSLRAAVNEAGYANSAQEAEKFYANVSSEIEMALVKEGSNITRQNTMPSAMMSPWRASYIKELPKTMVRTAIYIIKFDEVEVHNSPGTQTEDNGIRLFESITNNIAIYPPDHKFTVKGWFLQKNLDEYALALIDENDHIIKKIEMMESEDVYTYLCSEGIDEQSARNCRFFVELQDTTDVENIQLASLTKGGEIISKIPLDFSVMSEKTEEYVFAIDSLKTGNTDIRQNYSKKYVDRSNKIVVLYQKINWIFFVLASVAFFIILVTFVKKREVEDGESLLILGSILASLLVLVGGVSYSEISAFASIRYMYLSGAYPLLLAFEGLAILYICDKYMSMKGKKQNEKK